MATNINSFKPVLSLKQKPKEDRILLLKERLEKQINRLLKQQQEAINLGF